MYNSDLVKAQIKIKHGSLETAAALMGISPSTLTRLLNNISENTVNRLEKIGISIELSKKELKELGRVKNVNRRKERLTYKKRIENIESKIQEILSHLKKIEKKLQLR